jgi:hypothetical protein
MGSLMEPRGISPIPSLRFMAHVIDTVRPLFLEDTHRVSPFSRLVYCYSTVFSQPLIQADG